MASGGIDPGADLVNDHGRDAPRDKLTLATAAGPLTLEPLFTNRLEPVQLVHHKTRRGQLPRVRVQFSIYRWIYRRHLQHDGFLD